MEVLTFFVSHDKVIIKTNSVSFEENEENMEKQPVATPSTFPAKTAPSRSVACWRDRTALGLMLLAFAGAFLQHKTHRENKGDSYGSCMG